MPTPPTPLAAVATAPADEGVLAPAPAATLTHQTARGFAWMATQSIATKAITTVGQILLAWFLLPEDFGLAAIAYMFSVIPSLVQQGGVKEVLIRRFSRFHLWANAAFWMSMALGIGGGLVMAALAPVAADWYGEPRLFGLTLVIAVLFPLDSLLIVPLARIYGQMRFRFAAALSFTQGFLQTALAVAFAANDFGAYSLILPRLFIVIPAAIVCWFMAPAPVRWRPQVRRWKHLIGDGGLVIAANACEYALTYGGYLILSVLYDLTAVGLYYFAFNLSLQTFSLITQSLSGVLFPALNTLHDDPPRQAAAFLRATRMLAAVIFPVCLMQAALSDPVVHIVFDAKWYEAIPLLQFLSVGMAMRGVGAPAVALFQAQNRFGDRLMVSVGSILVFAIAAGLGAWLDGVRGMTIGAAVHMLLYEPFALWLALRHGGKGWKDLTASLTGPALVAIASIGPAWLLSLSVPPLASQHWWRLAIVLLVTAVAWFPLLRLATPDIWLEGLSRLRALAGRPHA